MLCGIVVSALVANQSALHSISHWDRVDQGRPGLRKVTEGHQGLRKVNEM